MLNIRKSICEKGGERMKKKHRFKESKKSKFKKSFKNT